MKTKTTNAVFIALVLTLSIFATGLAVAQETESVSEETVAIEGEVEIVESGVEPDSVLHGLDRAAERINLALTFNKVRKAEKALRIAEERLAEAEAMARKGKLDHAERAEKYHDALVEEAADSAEEIESNGDNETAKEALKEILKLRNKIESHSEKVSLVKHRILERQAERMTPEQLAKLRAIFERIENKSLETENKIHQKRENVKTKYENKNYKCSFYSISIGFKHLRYRICSSSGK